MSASIKSEDRRPRPRRQYFYPAAVGFRHRGVPALGTRGDRGRASDLGGGGNPGVPAELKDRPGAAVAAWLEGAEIPAGPAFCGILPGDKQSVMALSDRSVALIVKRRALAAGLDPTGLAGHSLRSGFLTSAAEAGTACSP